MLKHRTAILGIFILLVASSVTAPRMLINDHPRTINAASMLPALQPHVSVPPPEVLIPTTTIARASRGTERRHAVVSTPTTVARAPAPAQVPTGDFWRKLANCESSTGLGGNGGGFFQFSPDTAAKVGYHAGQSYATQLAEAQGWAARIHPREGSTSGWPRCWWVALRG